LTFTVLAAVGRTVAETRHTEKIQLQNCDMSCPPEIADGHDDLRAKMKWNHRRMKIRRI
jgi:hypothetical protein